MDSKDIQSFFGNWTSIRMSDEAKQVVHKNLQDRIHRSISQRSKRLAPIEAIRLTSAAILFLSVIVLGGLFVNRTMLGRQNLVDNPGGIIVPTKQFKPFIPPRGQERAFKEYGANGKLFIVGYGEKGSLAPIYPSPFMRVASMAYVVVKDGRGKQVVVANITTPNDDLGHRVNAIHIPMWFSIGNVWYGVLEDVYNNAVTSVYQFTPSATSSLGWTVRKFTPKSFDGQLLFKVGNRLLVRSSAIGNAPIWYDSFTQSGLETRPITQQWPKPGSIPNSVTVTLHESVSHQGAATITGPSTVHVRVGQTLIMRVTGDHSVPIAPMFYSDTGGDPGDGSLTTRLASPYKDTMMYRVVATSRHGLAAMVPWDRNTPINGLSKITIVSQ